MYILCKKQNKYEIFIHFIQHRQIYFLLVVLSTNQLREKASNTTPPPFQSSNNTTPPPLSPLKVGAYVLPEEIESRFKPLFILHELFCCDWSLYFQPN